MSLHSLDLTKREDGRPVEVHPNTKYQQVRQVTDFLDTMSHLTDEQRESLLMEALDTGFLSLPLALVRAPREARRMTEKQVRDMIQREVAEGISEWSRNGYVMKSGSIGFSYEGGSFR